MYYFNLLDFVVKIRHVNINYTKIFEREYFPIYGIYNNYIYILQLYFYYSFLYLYLCIFVLKNGLTIDIAKLVIAL